MKRIGSLVLAVLLLTGTASAQEAPPSLRWN